MPKWLQKSLVVLISVLTFGLVAPPQSLLIDKAGAQKTLERDTYEQNSADTVSIALVDELQEGLLIESEENLQSNRQKWVQLRVKDAKELSFQKFGERIKPKIENEFEDFILPNIEKVIGIVAEQYPEEDLVHLAISEEPGKGKSEKIFHIKDEKTGEDVIRFHVRRDQPPHEGYWFNFHYHTHHDDYQTHHDLGSIYWAKNTPPNWMS
ncbi:YpjP family protein [Bacillus marasmi]|uniref:YpjP family protein n=1 Tax=Bacillus marasmi TaxID=1926279 RepID=UPI0011C84B89|nr:YpjP family protein [Bacillus marasmi]